MRWNFCFAMDPRSFRRFGTLWRMPALAGIVGAHERIRTADPVLTKDVLYRLSYVSAPPSSKHMERETGFEPATPSLEGSCSSQLSYSRPTPLAVGGEGRIRTSEG